VTAVAMGLELSLHAFTLTTVKMVLLVRAWVEVIRVRAGWIVTFVAGMDIDG